MSANVDEVADRIYALCRDNSRTPRSVSIAATGSPDVIRYMKPPRRAMPSGDKIASIAIELGTSVEYLLGHTDQVRPETIRHIPEFRLPPRRAMPRDIPVYGTGLAADRDLLDTNGKAVSVEQVELSMSNGAIDYVTRPPALVGRKDIYAIYISGDSMSPRHYSGDAVLVEPSRPPAIGEDVLIVIKAPLDEGEEPTLAMVKRLVRMSATFVELEQFNPPMTFRIDREKVHSIQRIKPWSEAHGI